MRLSPRYRSVEAGRPEARRFSDRAEAFTAFRQALAEQDPEAQKVLNFWGVGGIGKSRLQHELREMLRRDQLGISVRLDFQAPTVRRQDAGLYQLRHSLRAEHGLELPLFDIAYAVYWQRANPEVPLSASELPLLSESEILGDIVSAAGNAPVVGVVVSLVKGLDLLGKRAQRWRRVREDLDLRNLDRLDVHEILDALTFFFARDLRHALNEHVQRCVIMLDAHEALWEDVTARGGRGDRDAWIRDLIAQTPGVLWVISSRDALKWGATDPEWCEPYLERHAIGDLPPHDRLDFLTSCGVEGPVARVIAEASNGVPFYLNVSVDHWESIRQEREPAAGDFGESPGDLLSRFIGHVPQPEEELLKVLSIPRSWDRELFEVLVRRFNISFPLSRWPDFCAYSFTRQTSGGRWVMHSLMREELRRRLSDDTALEVHVAIFDFEQERTENEDLPPSRRIESFREAVMHGLLSQRLTADWFMREANFFMYRGLWQAMSEVIDEMEGLITDPAEHPAELLRGVGDYLNAWILRQQGRLAEARAGYEALDLRLLKPFELGIRFQMANVLRETGQTRTAGQVYEELWSRPADATDRVLHRLVGIQYADFHYVQGRFPQAKAILDDIASLGQDQAAKEVAEAKRILGHIDRLAEQDGRGIELYRQARNLFARCDDVFGVAMTATNFAEALWPSDPRGALFYAAEATELNEALGSRLEVGKARIAIAMAHLVQGDHDRALNAAEEAVAIHVDAGYRSGEAQARLAQAFARASARHRPRAAEAALQAAAILEDLEAYPTLRLVAALASQRLDPTTASQVAGVQERARADIQWLGDPADGELRLERLVVRLLPASTCS